MTKHEYQAAWLAGAIVTRQLRSDCLALHLANAFVYPVAGKIIAYSFFYNGPEDVSVSECNHLSGDDPEALVRELRKRHDLWTKSGKQEGRIRHPGAVLTRYDRIRTERLDSFKTK